MDFNLNDEQELFVAGIRELMASENWEAYFAECDRDSVYPERFVKALADMGIDSLLIPEEHGGLDAGFVTLAAPLSAAASTVVSTQQSVATPQTVIFLAPPIAPINCEPHLPNVVRSTTWCPSASAAVSSVKSYIGSSGGTRNCGQFLK